MTNVNVFDKTGTLTKGKPEVTSIQAYGISEKELLTIASEAEMVSEHHLGRTIVKKAEEMNLRFKNRPTTVEVLKERGIQVSLNGKDKFIGNKIGMYQNSVAIPQEVEAYALDQEKKDNHAVFVADHESILGVISIADQIREEAKQVILQLKQNGINHMSN